MHMALRQNPIYSRGGVLEGQLQASQQLLPDMIAERLSGCSICSMARDMDIQYDL